MAGYITQLTSRNTIAERTMEFRFKKPADFTYAAGQHIVLTLIHQKETDERGNDRVFSLASAPYETDLIIACRMRETAFKRELKTMEIGGEVEVQGPYGSMALPKNAATAAVFLAGGIGITPFRSMLLDATRKGVSNKIFLFYSNKRPEDAVFFRELEEIKKKNPNYAFVGTMTEMEKSNMAWDGERGYISKEMLVKYIKDIPSPVYYVAGPPGMVLLMRGMLVSLGVEETCIQFEQFTGY